MTPRRVSTRRRKGAVLLEVIVAITILAIAGVALLGSAAAAYRAVSISAEDELRLRDAVRLMDAASLWSRAELDQRLGDRPQGSMLMRIDRAGAGLYLIHLFTAEGHVLLLSSALHRDRPTDATR